MLAAEIAGLAGLRSLGVADGVLATNVGVEMGTSRRAVAVSRDWLGVDVVDCDRWLEW